ncbi:MAG: methyltransferase domain-containing protein [Verrucomicrobiota bacterium]
MRFGEKAKQYREKATIQREVADWCAEWIGDDGQGLSAVEFGAGSGLFTERLLRKGFGRVLASDVSERMVEEGRRVLPGAEWRVCDAWEACGLNEGEFDCLYSCSLLQWAKEPTDVLRKWGRCLKIGGRGLATIFVEGSLKEFLEGDPDFGAVKFRFSDEWVRSFEAAGLSVERWDEMERVLKYESVLKGLHSLHDIGAVEEGRKSVGALRAFLKERDHAYRGNGYFPVTWKVLRVEVVKG